MNHSTGPRTPEGKQRTRLNALRHGLTGQTVVLPTEDLQAYKTFCNEFVVHYQPVGPVERQLVQTIADTSWRLNRISAMEHSSLSLAAAEKIDQAVAGGDHSAADNPSAAACAQALAFEEQSERFARLSLYEQRLARQLERSLKLIKETQADRKQQEREQQPAQKPQVAKEATAAQFVFSTAPSASPQPLIATKNHQPAASLAGPAPY